MRHSTLWFTALAALAPAALLAQQPLVCGTDQLHQELIKQDPTILIRAAELEAWIQQHIADMESERDEDTTTYYVPVVFHILYLPGDGDDSENITDSDVLQAMDKLNKDYMKLSPDTAGIIPPFQPIIGQARIQFRLATKDPQGNCTNGIHRVRTIETNVGDNGSKLYPWFHDKYLNIWTVDHVNSGAAAYSQYPSAVGGQNALADGVLSLWDYAIGNSHTLAHEIGHYMNLKHTWGDTNDPAVECGDDSVDDTPITKGHPPGSCTQSNLYDYTCTSAALDTVYTFASVTTSSGTTDPTPVPTVSDTTYGDGLIMSSFKAMGVSSNSALDGSFAFTDWSGGANDGETDYANLTGTIDTGKYYEFTVSPVFGRTMTLTSIKFSAGRSLDGPRTFAVRYSGNNYAANLPISVLPPNPALSVQGGTVMFFNNDTNLVQNGTTLSLSGSSFTKLTTPTTFRIYAWNAEDPAGYFDVHNVQVNGTFGIIEMLQNIMEYAYCNDEVFTKGQCDRMRAAIESSLAFRSNLWTDQNHQVTGILQYAQTCAPKADFYAKNRYVCEGTSVGFRDNSSNGTVTGRSWTFQDGTPATSVLASPNVSFSGNGWKTVTLTVTNAQGTDTKTDQYAVYVSSYAEMPGAPNEDFEDPNSGWKWLSENLDDNISHWQRVTGTGHSGNACFRMDGYNTLGPNDLIIDTGDNDVDELISPSMDLRWLSNMKLSFWHAYATRANADTAITETLKVFISTNCGRTWTPSNGLKTLAGNELITSGSIQSPYVPTSGNHWRNTQVTLTSSNAVANVRFKFQYKSGTFSNNIYLDDIQILANGVGIANVEDRPGFLEAFPNPTEDAFTVQYGFPQASKTSLHMLDASGREVMARDLGVTSEGTVQLDVRSMDLAPGVYVITLDSERSRLQQRLVVR